ncbi:hypothetical protein [Roseateles oligotrophus]|uniref:hypothetical protein n=1 Tax=Roseateles oligotrophus TaxID=1769250 RepID=UPI0016178B35|nr:hypothetical protein [Roseateles oligotrophus]
MKPHSPFMFLAMISAIAMPFSDRSIEVTPIMIVGGVWLVSFLSVELQSRSSQSPGNKTRSFFTIFFTSLIALVAIFLVGKTARWAAGWATG